jgi:hypothetical protein
VASAFHCHGSEPAPYASRGQPADLIAIPIAATLAADTSKSICIIKLAYRKQALNRRNEIGNEYTSSSRPKDTEATLAQRASAALGLRERTYGGACGNGLGYGVRTRDPGVTGRRN